MLATKKKENTTKANKLFERILVFGKAQISALIGGVTDYSIMVFVTEVFHVYYPISIAIGGVIGAVVNFSLNKGWTFRTKNIPYKNSFYKQMLKFVLVVLNSILLKSSGTYLITTFSGIDYKISRVMVDLVVSILFNYTLQKNWVFKKQKV
jgi:putative flippase GtrA